MRTVVALLFSIAAVLPAGGAAPSDGHAAADSVRVGEGGVTLALPPGWQAATPDDESVVDPVTRLAVASGPIGPRDVPCQVARYAFADDAVALVLLEWLKPQGTLSERPERFTEEDLPLQPAPAIECFDGSGGSIQFRDEGRVLGAYLLVGEHAPHALVDEALRVLDTLEVERPGSAGQRLMRNGISIDVPESWDGRMLYRDPTGSWGVVYQVANFELPPNEGFDAPAELPPGEEDPIKAMGAGDVLVTVLDEGTGGTPAPAKITLDDLRFLPADAPRVPRGHALAEGSFCYGARCLSVEVDFGDGALEAALRDQVDEVVASLAVERAPPSAGSSDEGPRGCPHANWQGPWTACAEAAWVRRVVDEGGYRIVGETGSALVVQGNGRSFYVWTTSDGEKKARALAAEAGNWRRLAVIDGVSVYGDDHLRRFWKAQGFIFWVEEGPKGDSIVPSPVELTGLVRASKVAAPPR